MRHFSFRPSITLRGRTFKGLRGWAGKPLHPPLTDVPVGAYMLAATFDLISFVDCLAAKDDYRHVFAQLRAFTYTPSGSDDVGSESAQIHH